MAERSLSYIARSMKAEMSGEDKHAPIRYLLLDSRKYRGGENYLFFALKGANHNGHHYIKDLYERGQRAFVVEELPDTPMESAIFLIVKDTLEALQSLAENVRQESSARIVGVTGSNGKTIVKEWLYQVLHSQYRVTRSPKSYNSQVGVPLSVWDLEANDDWGIFEAGISKAGEMVRLENILKPAAGIFTNIGSAHDQHFAGRREKIREKLLLFRHCEYFIYCRDHTDITEVLQVEYPDLYQRSVNWSHNDTTADLFVSEAKARDGKTIIRGNHRGGNYTIQIPFTDMASVENAIHCWLFCLHEEIDPGHVKEAFPKLQPVAMRLEMKAGIKDSIIVNDVYNSDLESLDTALHFLDQQAQKRLSVLVLSDILQTGLVPEELYGKVNKIIEKYDISELIGIGPEIGENKGVFGNKARFYRDTESFLKQVHLYNWENKAVLLKGARDFHFEDISRRMEQKSHETVLEIYLSRMVHNLNYYRASLKPGVKLMVMVKAFSYGSGSYEIASLLEFHKVDYLAVAYTDEGVELRKAGITLPIMVLNPEPASFDDIIHFELEPEIYSLRMLRLFDRALKEQGAAEPYPIHIKLDTGMHRLGFRSDQLEELVESLKRTGNFRVASLFSHLAAADDDLERSFTLGQANIFKEMSAQIEEVFGKVDRHILNSAGIVNYPEAQFEMVRLGIGLYGIGSSADEKKHLQPISELKATVSQIKILQPGDTVGYGRSFVATGTTKIATITIGYADGLRRSLSNGVGRVWIRDREFPVVGRICMDMTMIDVTGSEVEEGDEVEIFGTHLSIYHLAEKMQTIPYEVLTGISQRVKRIYFME